MTALIVRFSAIGDCVIAAWAVTAIRQRLAEATIDWAVDDHCADVVDQGRLVDRKILFPRRRFKASRWTPRTWRDQLAWYARLRERRYDIGVDLQGHTKTALCLAFAKPKRRAAAFATDAFARKLCPPVGERPKGMHQVDWMMRTISALGDFEKPAKPIMPATDARQWKQLGSPLVSIPVGTGHPSKTLPARKWAEIGRMMSDAGWTVAFFSGPEVQFSAPGGTHGFSGKTTLSELCSVVAASDLVIAADTGMGHMAAAYGIPVVSLFGPTDPESFRPYAQKGKVLTTPSRQMDHDPQMVIDAARDLMGGVWPKGS